MAAQNPYVPSAGILVQSFSQFRKMLPNKIDAETLKKLSLAPSNESSVLNVLRHLRLIDDNNQKTPLATAIFTKHKDEDFQRELASSVEKSYPDLFQTLGQNTWGAERSSLIGYFRVHDETSELTATRQSITFETLAALAGKRDSSTSAKAPSPRNSTKRSTTKTTTGTSTSRPKNSDVSLGGISDTSNDIGLTVRIEINLPAQGDQETYDRIFQSIRKNLLNA